MSMEFQADALNQLTTDDLDGKFAMLESSSVDDDLASLKKELSGSTKVSSLFFIFLYFSIIYKRKKYTVQYALTYAAYAMANRTLCYQK
ncbi:hypothetical protein HanIR_Chr05g0236831 [Helianthus annuus]|nr:hypothetical protein HanIR_Chr05g0236831 [Helianthus annuus]